MKIKTKKIEIFDAGIIYVKPEKLFADSKRNNKSDWNTYNYGKLNCVKLHCEFWMGIQGVEGTLALGISPISNDTDAWEGSCPAGTKDWWEFLGFSIVTDNNSLAELRVFHLNQTFFCESWNHLVKRINLSIDKEVHNLMTGHPFCDAPNDEGQWETLFEIFERELGAVINLKE
jgi:hypothetical protein